MLSSIDESFQHQVSFPQAVVSSSDPGWRERYWVNFQDTRTKERSISLGLGKYPNQDVFEGFVCLAERGAQTSLCLSRSISNSPLDNMLLEVGPLRVDVIEPFRQLRFVLGPNPSGLELDVTWTSVCEPVLEDRHLEIDRGRVTHDLIRYVQLGRMSGALNTPSGPVEVRAEDWYAERDHSWGLRPIPAKPGAPPARPPAWKFLMFCPLQFDTFAAHIYLYETVPGRPLHLSASLVGTHGHPDPPQVYSISHELTWVEGAPAATLAGGTIRFELVDGTSREVTLIAHPQRVMLRGAGYGRDHGDWKGDDWLEVDQWDLTDPEVVRKAAGASTDHLVEARYEDEVGYGVMEYVVRSGYPKYHAAQRRRPRREPS